MDTPTELVERQRIADVLGSYCARLDEYDIDAVAALFTEDCVTDYGRSRMSGGGTVLRRDAFRARIARSQSSWRRTHHQLGQMLIELYSHEEASALTYALTYAIAWHERWDGRIDELRIRYVDRLLRTDDGWRIHQRRMEMSGCLGLEDFDWCWVERHEPDKRSVPTPGA